MHKLTCLRCAASYEMPRALSKFCPDCRDARFHEREAATSEVFKAKKRGELTRAAEHICADCGKQARDWDHRDYTKPLEVVAVCHSCNVRRPPAYCSGYRPESATGGDVDRQSMRPRDWQAIWPELAEA